MAKLRFDKCRILVIGDAMLDCYVFGQVNRVSPEAPVPVIEKSNFTYHPGGAANTAANIASLGSAVTLCSMVGGREEEEVSFRQLLLDLKIDLWEPVISFEPWLTKKTRFIGNNFQLLRLDEDKIFDWVGEEEAFLLEFDSRICFGSDVFSCVVLSDYGKGVLSDSVCSSIVNSCVLKGIPVFVDPKDGDWGKYHGAYCVKPNLFELSKQVMEDIYSVEDIKRVGTLLMEKYDFFSMAVTMGDRGLVLLCQEEPCFMYFCPHLVEVSDVSGAGDTVMAVLATCYSVGLPLSAGAYFANKAAAAVVTRKGTQTVRLSDIQEETGCE